MMQTNSLWKHTRMKNLNGFNLSHLNNLVIILYNYMLHFAPAHNLLSNHVAKYSMNLAHELASKSPIDNLQSMMVKLDSLMFSWCFTFNII